MKLEKRRISTITLMLLLFTSIGIAYAVPQAPHQFYGEVTIGGEPARDGILIEAIIDEITYESTTTVEGRYGWDLPLFMVPADDPNTPEKEGGSNGETVEFYVNGVYATSDTFLIGLWTSLNLSIPNDPPVADANGPYTGTEGINVPFNGSASSDPDGEIVSYEWEFGDEGESDEENPTHVYAQEGNYTVTLTVSDYYGFTNVTSTTAEIADSEPAADFTTDVTEGMEPLTVTFTDGSMAYDMPMTFSWDFGDGSALSTERSPIHEYLQDGVYPVTLTVTEDDGDFDTATTTITVTDSEPAADFTADFTEGPESLTVTFTSTSTSHDGIISWLWEFGDGVSDTQETPTHEYLYDDVFTVTLLVAEADGDTDTEVKTDYITVTDSDPVAAFTADVTEGPESLTVTFTDASTAYDAPMTYIWDFNDGSTLSTEQNPVHDYVQDGVYTVTLTVTDLDGSTAQATETITVIDSEPMAAFTADVTEGMEPLTVEFTDVSISWDGIVSWLWDFGDGETNTTESPTHEYIQDGVYTVNLTVTEEDGDFDTATTIITVTASELVAAFEAVPLSGDEPLTVQFLDSSLSWDGIVSWLWDFGDGETSTLQHPTHEYIQDDVYTVTLTVSEADGDSDTETNVNYITVSDTDPVAAFTVDVSEGMEPLTVTFTDASTAYDMPMTYIWDFNDGSALVTVQSPIHEFLQDGDYILTLTVTDSDGSTDEATYTITVTDSEPVAAFTAVPLSGDEPLTVTFLDASTAYDTPMTYSWNFGDGETSTLQSPTHEYVEVGVYTVTLTVTEADGDFNIETKTDYIEVYSVIESYDIALEEGWNLISIPLIPSDSSIEVILADVLDSVRAIWSYDAGVWYSYKPGAPSGLTEMVEGKGYWMNMSTSTVLSVSGTEIFMDPPAPPPSYPLIEGWNLIGMPYIPEDSSIETVFSGILDYIETIWSYQAGNWYSYKPGAPSSLTEILDGNGYWIKMTTDIVWYPEGD